MIIEKKNSLKDFFDHRKIHRPGKKRRKTLTFSQDQKDYLEYLHDHLKSIVKATPEKLREYKQHFDGIIDGSAMKQDNVSFRNELLRRLGYDKLRESYYPRFFTDVPINACVYCNSQLAVSARSKNGKRIAKFQVDHFYPKSEYPCFSISYFNLFPACQPCNGRKSAKPLIFDLYSDDASKLKSSKFKFELDRKSVIKYRLSGMKESLDIQFKGAGSDDYGEAFDIQGIYATQKDAAEELVLMSIVYDRAYLESLKTSFERLYPKKAPMASRLVVGAYTREADIHKRPMSKFRQDLARQLGLID